MTMWEICIGLGFIVFLVVGILFILGEIVAGGILGVTFIVAVIIESVMDRREE